MTCGLGEGAALAERSLGLVEAAVGSVGPSGSLAEALLIQPHHLTLLPNLGGRFCTDLSAGLRELLMWGAPSGAGLMLIKAFPAGYEITIL